MYNHLKEIEDFRKTRNLNHNTFYILYVDDHPEEDLINDLVEEVFSTITERFPFTFEIYVALDLNTAINYITEMEIKWDKNPFRSYKGFDATICDLHIPKSYNKKDQSVENGYSFIKRLSDKDWPAPVIVLSNWTDDDKGLNPRIKLYTHELEQGSRLLFDDFLSKKFAHDWDHKDLTITKFRRQLIPLFFFEKLARRMKKPTYFIGTKMLRVMRQLVQIAMFGLPSDDPKVKLPQILFLGHPGTGKSQLAYFYSELLKLFDTVEIDGLSRPENVEHINCGFLSGNDLGGRIDLFGAENRDQHNVISNIADQRGAFEKASVYQHTDGPLNFARPGEQPCYKKGGVVFLDEFANLHSDLQAAVLTILEEGVIRRAISNTQIKVGCHVICATNVDPSRSFKESSELGNKNSGTLEIRNDLIDRIPFVIVLPSIKDYSLDEIENLVELFASKRAGTQVIIAPSALKLLGAAIDKELVNSIRHLQSIANVGPGETIITEANLRWVIEKGIVLKKPITDIIDEKTKTTKEMALFLGLPDWLQKNDLPEWTKIAIKHMYDSYNNKGLLPFYSGSNPLYNDVEEIKGRTYLLVRIMKKEYVNKLFPTKSNKDSLNTELTQQRKKFNMTGLAPDGREKKAKEILISTKKETIN